MHLLQLRNPAITRVSVAALAASLILLLAGERSDAQTAQSSCRLSQLALCETFDAPSALGAGTRSGNLNGVLRGVSRATSADNPSAGELYHWTAGTRSTCGSAQAVAPEQDVAICNGQLVETVNDGEQVTVLALYPRQLPSDNGLPAGQPLHSRELFDTEAIVKCASPWLI